MWLPPQPLRLVCDGGLRQYLLVCEPDPYITRNTRIGDKSGVTVKLDINVPVCGSERTHIELQVVFDFLTSFNKLNFGNLCATIAIRGEVSDKVFLV